MQVFALIFPKSYITILDQGELLPTYALFDCKSQVVPVSGFTTVAVGSCFLSQSIKYHHADTYLTFLSAEVRILSSVACVRALESFPSEACSFSCLETCLDSICYVMI